MSERDSIVDPIRGALVLFVVPSTLHIFSQRVEYMNFIVIAAVRRLLMLPWKRPLWGLAKGGRKKEGGMKKA